MSDVAVWRYVLPPKSHDEGWGIFLLDSSGMFTTVSDYGNYAFKWLSFGPCFRSFVTKLDASYLCSKLGSKSVYDPERSAQLVREHILYYRRCRSLSREAARSEWDLLELLKEDFRDWYTETRLDDAFEFCVESYPGNLIAFAEKLYPRFCEVARADLERERSQAFAP